MKDICPPKWAFEHTDKTMEIAAQSGNTNGGLKLNRLRLYRARLEVQFYEHMTSGGRRFDEEGTRLAHGMRSLAKEIKANEGFC